MGQAILYCCRCSTQLRDIHFEQGKAFRIDARSCCADCAPEVVRTLPPDLVQKLLAQTKEPRPAAPASSPRASGTRVPAVETASRRLPKEASRLPWILGGAAAVLCIVIGAVLMMSGTPDDPPPDRTATPLKPAVKDPPKVAAPAAPDTPARAAFRKAQDYAAGHPDDLFGQLGHFEDLTLLEDKTEVGAEARKTAQTLRVRGKEAVERALASLDAEMAGGLSREGFGAALDLLEAARARMGWPEWKLGLDKRIREIQDRMDKLYEPLRTKALAAKAAGNAVDLQSTVARVQGWGSPRITRDLNDVLGRVSAAPTRIMIDNAELKVTGNLKYVGGEEFPGALGGLKSDGSVAHTGKRCHKLEADFSGGGAYVGIWYDLSGLHQRDFRELRLWVKTSTVARFGVRFADESGQVHQKNGGFNLAQSDKWQEVVLRTVDIAGGEHWGGANDGKWHGPMTGFGINVGKDVLTPAGAKQGVIWIDDLEGVLVPHD